MSSEEKSSDTHPRDLPTDHPDNLHWRLEQTSASAGRVRGTIAETAIEALEEAGAERDQLHDALRERLVVSTGPGVPTYECRDCGATFPGRSEKFTKASHHNESCLLRGVERGDTVTRIQREARREAFEEAAQVVDPPYWLAEDYGEVRQEVADQIRALADGDQEDDEDG